MRLKHVYISEYKNLKEFSLDFEGDNFIEVLVGRNGTGKSNLFEAVLEIFRHLYERDYQISFNYQLKYEIEERQVYIQWDGNRWLNEDGQRADGASTGDLPHNILIYYSGHNGKVADLIRTYEIDFKSTLNRNRKSKSLTAATTRRFIGINNEYKSILLAVLLLQPEKSKARGFIIEKLGVKAIGGELKIVFRRPDYATSNEYDFDEVDHQRRFWGAEGITRDFLNLLWEASKLSDAPLRKEGFFADEDRYYLYRDISSVRKKFESSVPLALFRGFDNLRTIGMLDEVSIEIELDDGNEIDLDQFSDGQFQSIYIYTITELFKDENCIVLLDEPDSFLHPEWQFDFLKHVNDISTESSKSNHVLMTSHSAVTLLNNTHRKVWLLDFHEGGIKGISVAKEYAVRNLASKLMKLNADKQILSVIHSVDRERSILFTEGHSDPLIVYEAWNQLYEEEIPFDVYFGFGCQYLRFLLQDDKILQEMDPNPIFGLFDFDGAYNEWNSIPSDEEDLIQPDPFCGLIKKIKGRNSYAVLIPVPDIPVIEGQVIRNKADKTTFEGESQMEIEHLFYCDETKKYFRKVTTAGGGEILEVRPKAKMKFAKEVVPTLEKAKFEVFRPVFEFIMSKLVNEKQHD